MGIIPLEELTDLLDWELDEKELKNAAKALETLEEYARFYGSTQWRTRPAMPPFVQKVVVAAAARYLYNAGGYVQSRAGDETLMWAERNEMLGRLDFTDDEKKQIAKIAGKNPTFGTVGIYAHQQHSEECRTLPVTGHNTFEPFPDVFDPKLSNVDWWRP